ncbi:hypothetical protein [Sneathiella limimaris]|uniref:hypothetical protein n=1 Tax=Sneathiella limimaris TaxID=1964213 RepID=UPI00146ED77A|nr:hypothetical protein [Sneathiella limimaris]
MAKYSFKSLMYGAFVLAATSFVAISAQAARPAPPVCGFGPVLITSAGTADLTTSIACEVYDGINDTQAHVAAEDPFGITDWVLADKSDGLDGDHKIVLKDVVNGGNSGSWSVDSFNGYTDVFLTLKSENAFVAYLIDTSILGGDWTTFSVFPSGGGGKGLSHMSLYYSASSLTTVPLPAALPLYAAGIAILGFFGYRRRKSA